MKKEIYIYICIYKYNKSNSILILYIILFYFYIKCFPKIILTLYNIYYQLIIL